MKSRSTIRDVACLASTSVASVSRYINSEDVISECLMKRIESAIVELGYIPSAGARSLSVSFSDTIGLIIIGNQPAKAAKLVLELAAEICLRKLRVIMHVERSWDHSTVRVIERFNSGSSRTIVIGGEDSSMQHQVNRIGGIIVHVSAEHLVATVNKPSDLAEMVEFIIKSVDGPISFLCTK